MIRRPGLPRPRQGAVNPLEGALFAEDGQEMVETRAGGVTAAGQARGMHQHTRLHAKLLRHGLERIANRVRLERLQLGQGVAEPGQARFVLGREIFLRRRRVVFDLLFEIEAGVGG